MIYRVKEPFAFTDSKGVPRVMSAGDLVTEGHAAFRKSWLHLMEPVQDAADRAKAPLSTLSETATAAPDERRAVSAPPKVSPSVSELDILRQRAEDLGVKVDGRWSIDRLRQEIDLAKLKPGNATPKGRS